MRSRTHCWNELSVRLRALCACAESETLATAVLEVQGLIHEARAHQLALEAQNRELRASRDALLASHDRYAHLYEFAPVGYVTLDPCGRIDEMNLTAATMLARDRDAALGRSFNELAAVEDPDALVSHLARCLRERHSATLELRARPWPHAAPLILQVTSTPLSCMDGRDRCLTVISDVTERRALEQETSRFKDDFLGVVSHELRTPLTAVLGWASMLSREPPPDAERLRRGLGVLRRNAEALAHVVEDLIDVSRIVSGKMRMHTVSTHLEIVVGGALHDVRAAADAKGVSIDVSIDPQCWLMGDPERLHQVVWHLMSNAIKFSRESGAGRVEVVGVRVGDLVRLTVRDDGCGIDAEHLPHVFERFRQLDPSTTRTHFGLGLGLAIVRHIVEAHAGCVVVESAGAGQGAAFTVDLPAAADVRSEVAVAPTCNVSVASS